MNSQYKVLVTGASGFVGRHLCQELASEFSLRRTVRQAAGQQNTSDLVVIDDIGPDTDWQDALQGIDAVVHLAARVHVMKADSAEEAICRRVNVEGAWKLAAAAAAAGIRHLIFLSTVKVHGEQSGSPLTEQSPLAPVGPYAESKREAEESLWQVAADTDLDITILRPPLIYGPGVKANLLRLMQLIDRGRPLPLASIKNQRSLIGVSNLVDLIRQCLRQPQRAAQQTFLISDNDDVSVPELIRRLATALDQAPRLFPCPLPLLRATAAVTGRTETLQKLCSSLAVDSSLVRNTLDWTPPCSMAIGFSEMAAAFQEHREMPS